METFTYFPLLPRDIQLMIWELYEASPVAIRHHLTIGHRQIAYAALNPSNDNDLLRNEAGEDDPAEVRLDPFCKHKFTKIKLATPAFSVPPGAGDVSIWARLGDKWPVTEQPSYVYADLERDVFFVAMMRNESLSIPRVGCLDFYPAVCWIPEALSRVRNIAVPANGDKMHETFRHLEGFPNLRTVRVVLRLKQRACVSVDGHAFLRRTRDLPRDAFGFVELHRFCAAFNRTDTAYEITWDLFGMGIEKIRSASWCNRYSVNDGVEKIPVVDAPFDIEL
ncbi:hypothetical protein LQW54_006871 [Pestalotiopsis sp. IQ-011]